MAASAYEVISKEIEIAIFRNNRIFRFMCICIYKPTHIDKVKKL